MSRKPALGFSLAILQQCCCARHLCRAHVPGFHPSQLRGSRPCQQSSCADSFCVTLC